MNMADLDRMTETTLADNDNESTLGVRGHKVKIKISPVQKCC